MKRGVLLNLKLLLILILLAGLPFLVMFGSMAAANVLSCEMGGGSMPGGLCGVLYAIVTVVGWSLIAIIPLIGGAFLLYFIGIGLYFFASLLSAWRKGQPVSPVATGMLVSTLVFGLLAGGVAGGVWVLNSNRVDIFNNCEVLPTPSAISGRPNGPLALAVKVPADSDLETRTILAVTPDNQFVFQIDKSYWGRGPAWSPDGTQLALVTQDLTTRQFELRLRSAQGEIGPALIAGLNKLEDLSWTPDGQSLLFTGLSEEKDTELFMVQADGSGLRRLTNSPGWDSDARISPDGTQIVFVSNRDGNDDIYVMDINGQNVRRLTTNKAQDVNPAWSPDGQWIVFASNRGSGMAYNNYDLYTMAADGDNQCQLTQGERTEWEPAWSPDGQSIAYIALLERKVYLVSPDGSETRLFEIPVAIDDVYELDWAAQSK